YLDFPRVVPTLSDLRGYFRVRDNSPTSVFRFQQPGLSGTNSWRGDPTPVLSVVCRIFVCYSPCTSNGGSSLRRRARNPKPKCSGFSPALCPGARHALDPHPQLFCARCQRNRYTPGSPAFLLGRNGCPRDALSV